MQVIMMCGKVTGLEADYKVPAKSEGRIEEWVEKWVQIGLSTDQADFEAATEAALSIYAACGFEQPMVMLHVSSPWAAILGGEMAVALLAKLPSQQNKIVSLEDSKISQLVFSGVSSPMGPEDRLFENGGVRIQVKLPVSAQVDIPLERHCWAQIRFQGLPENNLKLFSQIKSQVESQVGHITEGQAWSSQGPELSYTCGVQISGGWAGWGASLSFHRDVLGWSDPNLKRLELDEALIQSAGVVWWHENVLVIWDRPSQVHRDDQGRLHNEIGPAVKYRDGWSLWSWHGIPVPRDIIEKPKEITFEKIENQNSSEIGRVMIEQYGYEKFIADAGMKLVSEDMDTHGNPRKLWRRKISGRNRVYYIEDILSLVEVINSSPEPDGSFKRYILAVPEFSESGDRINTPQAAIAWTFGMTADEYRTDLES